jgi:hypothetical protein
MRDETKIYACLMGALLLNPADEFSRVLTIPEAATAVGVTVQTVNRWIRGKHLLLLPGPTRLVTERAVRECEAARHRAAHQGRPGARVRLDVLT